MYKDINLLNDLRINTLLLSNFRLSLEGLDPWKLWLMLYWRAIFVVGITFGNEKQPTFLFTKSFLGGRPLPFSAYANLDLALQLAHICLFPLCLG